ncbi:somatomedin-B and thrombospondin type-1 domain-containing protein [Octopus bimaculoides]|uniref:somatomedin-B and thrombospondin type-1 domain-containing protein n=1 Tax=Octopus bimaculoides TaxID=37653 RepID=UPI00071C5EB5|nr:somatomedin-B and thrombospondin type-1 domain-containing protein [Octopus bimaculoides]|eukprot:XP_014777908.1 PREDICTED: somatomedin-B and thrombospondin type-1 domain-containing protein-like [Octopus bimaculoides]
MKSTKCLAFLLVLFCVAGYLVDFAECSCQKHNLCCTGRDNTCWTYGEPRNAANQTVSQENDTLDESADVISKPQRRCFCDEGCSQLNDCCTDYTYVCRPVDCYVSQWTEWNCGDSCIHGVQIRERHVSVKAAHGGKECPALKQKRVCRGEACDMQRVDKQRQELSEIGYILPGSFGVWRTNKEYDPAKGINKNLFFHYQHPNKIVKRPTYCATYLITSSREGCNSSEWANILKKKEKVCVECQPLAMSTELGLRCKGHGVTNEITNWHAMDVPHCHGEWVMTTKHDDCTCHLENEKGFIFV